MLGDLMMCGGCIPGRSQDRGGGVPLIYGRGPSHCDGGPFCSVRGGVLSITKRGVKKDMVSPLKAHQV